DTPRRGFGAIGAGPEQRGEDAGTGKARGLSHGCDVIRRRDMAAFGELVEACVTFGGGETKLRLQRGAFLAVENGEGGTRRPRRVQARPEVGLHLLNRQCKPTNAEHDRLASIVVVDVQQPAGAPEDEGLDAGVHLAGLEPEVPAVAEVVV